MQFALVTMVVLPLVPDRTFGPLSVLNPRQLWWMVVLIVGIGLLGYVAQRRFGAHTGALLGGLLGGLVSSTATTVSFARRTRDGLSVPLAAVTVVVASAVVIVRVQIELLVVARRDFAVMAAPIAALLLVMAALAARSYWRERGQPVELPEPQNPSELGSAVLFGALYGVVLLAAAAADRFGDAALFGVAFLSGLTDVDAITLSTGRLVQLGRLAPDVGWRVVMVALVANLLFKIGVVALLGSRPLLRRIGFQFLASAAAAGALLAPW